MNRVLPTQVSVIQAGLASGGGWARLTPTVGRLVISEVTRLSGAHMNTLLLRRVILLATTFGFIVLQNTHVNSQQNWQQPGGDVPPIIQGGEWRGEFSNWEQLSIANNVEMCWGRLYLKLEEYLNWKQTWTAHFAPGDFLHTEAISDSVRLALIPGSNQYFATGVYTSTVFDAGRPVDWSSANWFHSGTFYAVTLEYQTGNTPVPDSTWSNWTAPTIRIGEFYCSHSASRNQTDCVSNMSGIESSRYIQYRASFNSSDPSSSVALYDINIVYGIHHLTGTATSELIPPIDLQSWKEIFYTSTVPISTSLTIDILSSEGTVLMSNVSSGDSLTGLAPSVYPSIRLQATLTTDDPSHTPEIDVWGVKWFVSSRLYLPIVHAE